MFVTKYYRDCTVASKKESFDDIRDPHQGPPFTFINMRPSLD